MNFLKLRNYFFLVVLIIFFSFLEIKSQSLTKEDTKSKLSVYTLSFNGEKDMIDLMPELNTYPNLTNLDLSGSLIQNEDLIHIKNPKLYSLNLANTIINSEGLPNIPILSRIRNLNLEGSLIDDSALNTIARMYSLDSLAIGRTNVTDKGISVLHNLKVSVLDLTALKVTDSSLDSIASMENLRTLHLWNTKMTFTQSASVEKLKLLRELTLAGSEVGNEGLRNISKLPELKALNLSWTKVNEDGVKHLIENQSIEVLGLSGTKTSGSIGYLAKMKKLKILTLEDVALTNSNLNSILSIPHLKVLYLTRNSVEVKSIKSFVKKIPWAAVYYNGKLQFIED